MARKKLKELNLMDNFLFWTMVSYPGIGEPFVRSILETAFGQKFGKLTVIPECSYPGSDTNLHGARLDVYVESPVGAEKAGKAGVTESSAGAPGTVEAEPAEGSAGIAGTVGAEVTEGSAGAAETVEAEVTESSAGVAGKMKVEMAESSMGIAGTVEAEPGESSGETSGTEKSAVHPVTGRAVVYDLEPDNNSEKRAALPRRVRFYHSKIDSFSLQSGEGYDALKDVFVVMILSYDPFGENRMVYTVKNQCREQPDLEYEDGAATIFLYTKGTKGRAPEELRQLLRYFEKSTEENAVNETLRKVHQMVETVKEDGDVAVRYLRIMEHEQDVFEKGVEQGVKQGRQEERNNTERERKRADTEKRRADAAETRADAERTKADAERTRADAAERELLEMRRELERLRAAQR